MDITKLLKEHNIPYKSAGDHHHCRSGWVNIDCTNCSKDSQHWRLGINLTYHYANCWNCGHHSLLDVLHELTSLPRKTLYTALGSLGKTREESPVRGVLRSPMAVGTLQDAHRRYLEGRGLDSEEAERLWGVQGISRFGGRLAWRLFIPVHYQGEVVSWTTRTIGINEPRYISAGVKDEKMKRSELLFGEDYCRHSVVVCEGPLDAIRIGPGATAIMGLNYSQAQLLKMSKYPVRVVCLDNTPDAQKRAKKLCRALEIFTGDTYNITLDSKDPGEATNKEIQKIREFLV